jgi:hypothetical protein
MNNMFDLEQSIAEWRRQMLAAGIKTPVPLEELEIHLREEVDQQMKSGLNEQEVFNSAVQTIGQGKVLENEFKIAVRPHDTVMKRTMLTILWMFVFFLVGSGIYVGLLLLFQHFLFENWWIQPLTCSLLGWLGSICLPFLALMLGMRGKLPGTQSRKSLVQK